MQCIHLQLTLNKYEALEAGDFMKRNDLDFIKVGSRSKVDFEKGDPL